MTRHATVFFQVTMIVLAAANQYEALFPPAVSKFIPFLLLVVSGVQAYVAHGYSPNGVKLNYIAPRDLPDEPSEKR